jgi:peptide deformylase
MNLGDLELIPFGDKRLNEAPARFDYEKDDAELVSKLLHEKCNMLNGAGLSANQVGLDMQVFTMVYGEEFKRTLFNPLLVSVSDETCIEKEGCLSFPGLWLSLSRPSEATFQYTDVEGKEVIETYTSVAARIALHEYDHMLGKNFTMRASKFKLDRAIKGLDKKVKRFKRNVKGVRNVR